MLPHGHAHSLDPLPSRRPELSQSIANTRASGDRANVRACASDEGDPEASVTIISGIFRSHEFCRHPITVGLPASVRLQTEQAQIDSGLISSAVKVLRSETAAGVYSSFGLVSKLAELLFINILRHHYADANTSGPGDVSGLTDTKIASAVIAIHQKPERRWTVAELGRHAGMSRSRFAARFPRLNRGDAAELRKDGADATSCRSVIKQPDVTGRDFGHGRLYLHHRIRASVQNDGLVARRDATAARGRRQT